MREIRQVVPDHYSLYQRSICTARGTQFALVQDQNYHRFLFVNGSGEKEFRRGERCGTGRLFPLSWENAQTLSGFFPWLKPVRAGMKPALGTGDRIGLATPGHIRAIKDHETIPVLAQQSIREMERTDRSPEDVMNTAMWGVFQEGYKGGYVADADHLKSREAVKKTAKVGYTMYTCDPSDYVNDQADEMRAKELKKKFIKLDTPKKLIDKYVGKKFTAKLPSFDYQYSEAFTEESLMRAAVKYYEAIKFAAQMFGWVKDEYGEDFDFEVSVDETAHPTTALEHIFVTNELKGRGVNFTSLAPRFVGDIQKGIDYIGDLDEFERDFKKHAAIARTFGPYKLSLHSGSDKFRIYPLISKISGSLYHVKTAGTSYLEVVRLIAEENPKLLRRIYKFAVDRFDRDKATYHVTTDLSKVPDVQDLKDSDLPGLLDRDETRQLFHITYGSVLSGRENGQYLFREKILKTLKENEEKHFQFLKKHIGHHLDLLSGGGTGEV